MRTEVKRDWTPDELAAEMYRRQGFLVVCPIRECEVGDTGFGVVTPLGKQIQTPLRITGPSNRQEHLDQCRLQEEITNRAVIRFPINSKRYFYRAEGAD